MNTHGLVGRVGGRGWRGGYSGASRDYADPVACAAKACPFNDKRGLCSTPSMAIFNSDAQCITYLEFKSKPAQHPTTGTCRQCGGRVKLDGGKWRHDGEQLSHEVVL